MAGGFVHITAAAEALGRLGDVEGLAPADKLAISQFMPFVEVGAVGPDYPYLGRQPEWADRMHYENTGEVICNGLRVLRRREPGVLRIRCLAWLLGYAAHVATDLTIHPVVLRRVGPYEENKTAHRTCEMHQDAYICWPRRNLGALGLADYFRENINHCSTDDGRLHQVTLQNPDQLKPLAGYYVTARQVDGVSIVLLCDRDKKRALAEDAGCTSSRLDGRWWTEMPDAGCGFHLNPATVCVAKL